MGVVAKIISALAAILPIVAEWWAKRQAAQEQAAVEDRVAAVRADPAGEFMREFNPAGEQHDNDAAGEAGPFEPPNHG